MPANPALRDHSRLGPIVVFGFYAFLCIMGLGVFTAIFSILGYLAGAVAATTTTAFVANWVSIRIFERAPFLNVGLWWSDPSLRNTGIGVVLGAGSALLVTVLPAVLGAAEFVQDPEKAGGLASLVYVTILLVFGAAAEELMFRGYAFQVLARGFGGVATLAVTSVLFGLVHTSNLNFNAIAMANTIGFGVILGLAMLRTGALWLPIGLHFGWNWVPPLVGVNLSGFNMGVTGYTLRWKIPDLWSGGAYGPEGGLLTTGIVLVLVVIMARMPVRKELAAGSHETVLSEPSSEA
jgi:membrane protease YdiL (CAAX protease family)